MSNEDFKPIKVTLEAMKPVMVEFNHQAIEGNFSYDYNLTDLCRSLFNIPVAPFDESVNAARRMAELEKQRLERQQQVETSLAFGGVFSRSIGS